MAKESQVVTIRCQKDLSVFLRSIAGRGGIGVEKVGDKYFACNQDRLVEFTPIFSKEYTLEDFNRQLTSGAVLHEGPHSLESQIERKSALYNLNLSYQPPQR